MRILPTRLLFIALAATLLLAGCNGINDASSSANSAPTPTTPVPTPENKNPTANAGPDHSVVENSQDTLTGSGTDADGTIAGYAWKQTGGPDVTLTTDKDKPAVAGYTAPDVSTPTELTFELTVTDNDGATASDSVVVTVEPTLQVTGKVTDGPIANATVTVTVDGESFTTITDASGNYTITVPTANANAFMTATATADGGVELVSLLGTFATLQAQGIDAGSINITNVTTAKAVLIQSANDGKLPTDQASLDELDKDVDTTRLLDLAVAIKLVIDDPEFTLPEGTDNTLDLVSDPDTVDQFLADVDATDPTARQDALNAVLSDPDVVTKYTDATVPSVYRIAYANTFDAGIEYRFTADHTGAVSADGYNQSYTWQTNDAGQIVITYDNGGLLQHGFCVTDAATDPSNDLIDCDVTTTKTVLSLVTAGAQADSLLEEDIGSYAYPNNDESPTDPVTFDITGSGGVGVKPNGVIPFDPAEVAGAWGVPGIGIDPDWALGLSNLNLEPGVITLNADNTGSVNGSGRTFDWKLDSDNSLLLTYADGTTVRLLRLRKDGIAIETMVEVTDGTGEVFAGGGEMVKVDPTLTFTADNVPGRYNLFPGDPNYDTFYMRFDAGGLGAQEFTDGEGNVLEDDAVAWSVKSGGVLEADSVYNVATDTDFDPTCTDPTACQIWGTRSWTPLATDGQRIYVLEVQHQYAWAPGLPWYQGDVTFTQRDIRFWDKSAVQSVTSAGRFATSAVGGRTAPLDPAVHVAHPAYKPLFQKPRSRDQMH